MPVVNGWCCRTVEEIVVQMPTPCPTLCDECIGPPPSMIDVSEFLPELRQAAPNAEDDFLRFLVVQAAGEIAERSGLIRRTFVQPIQAGVRDYYWEDDAGQTRPVLLRGYHVVTKKHAYRRDPETGIAERFMDIGVPSVSVTPDHTLRLPFAPECNDGCVVLYYSVAPRRTACKIDSIFFEQWQPAVMHGALSKLFRFFPGNAQTPNEFFSPAAGFEHQKAFEAELSRIMATRDTQRAIMHGMDSSISPSMLMAGI
jgi:hypothetical protein